MGNSYLLTVVGLMGRKSKCVLFTKSNLEKTFKYFLQNCYFKLDNKLFRQITGILVGSNPVPVLANLSLKEISQRTCQEIGEV